MKALPPDVKVTVVYDRTALIDRAVTTLEEKLIEESIVVALVCLACFCCTCAARWWPSSFCRSRC